MHTEPPLSSHTNFPETKFQIYSLVNENHILNFANEFMPDVFQFLEPCTVNSLTRLYFNFKEFATLALFHSVIITQVRSREQCLVLVDNNIADMLLLNVAYRVYK